MFERIVLALDGSEPSGRAFEAARRLAERLGAAVAAVHVVELVPARGAGFSVRAEQSEVTDRVHAQVDELRAAGIDAWLVVRRVTTGGPAPVIAEEARDRGADLIVAGTRGHGRIVGLVIGSVAQRLLQLAPCPVLVVTGDQDAVADRRERTEAAA
jgi:nucleotide-binding universal stress UspA family protein